MKHMQTLIVALSVAATLTAPLAAQASMLDGFPPKPSEFPAPAPVVTKDLSK